MKLSRRATVGALVSLPALGASRANFAVGRRLVWAFSAGEIEALWKQSSPKFQARLKTPQALEELRRKVEGDFGVEARLVSETVESRDGITTYARTAQFSLYPRGVVLELKYDSEERLLSVRAMAATKEAPSPNLEKDPITVLRLPFDGAWTVLWGGRGWVDNRHASVPDERFALDLLKQRREGGSFNGSGRMNTDYLCFGEVVRAPAGGIVMVAADGMPDNAPGSVNTSRLYGNYIVIDHGHQEYSLLAHLKMGSLKVKPQQTVTSRAAIALCGNSGISTEPHLHYQLMDHPNWTKAHGLPSLFQEYRSNGNWIAIGEPQRGELIEYAKKK